MKWKVKYSKGIKLEIIKEYLNSECTVALATKYNITIQEFIRDLILKYV